MFPCYINIHPCRERNRNKMKRENKKIAIAIGEIYRHAGAVATTGFLYTGKTGL